jgi:hypothetical protein
MYMAVISNRSSPPAILLRESYREAGKIKNRTPPTCRAGPPNASSNSAPCAATNCSAAEAVEIVRSLPHGHVLATLGAARRIALEVTAKNENLERARNSRTTVVPEPPIRLSPSGSLLRTCSNPVSGNPPARSPTSGDAAAHQIQ